MSLQVALLGPDASGSGQNTALAATVDAARSQAASVPPNRLPEPVAVLPNRVRLGDVLPQLSSPRAAMGAPRDRW